MVGDIRIAWAAWRLSRAEARYNAKPTMEALLAYSHAAILLSRLEARYGRKA